jgi:hypothetical protein
MAGPILVFLVIVVISMVIGAVSQVLKAAQQAAPPPRARPRPAAAARPASGDIDRFLEEIDRLRKKKAEGGTTPERPAAPPPVAKPVKVAKALPAAKRRRVDPPTVASPLPVPRTADAAPVPVPVAAPDAYQRSEVTAQPRLAAPLRAGGGPGVTASPGQPRRTKFGRDLAALLASPQATPMAVVLTEVLGPPKCRKG